MQPATPVNTSRTPHPTPSNAFDHTPGLRRHGLLFVPARSMMMMTRVKDGFDIGLTTEQS